MAGVGRGPSKNSADRIPRRRNDRNGIGIDERVTRLPSRRPYILECVIRLLCRQDGSGKVQAETDQRNIASHWPPVLHAIP